MSATIETAEVTRTHIPTAGPMPHTDEWYALRSLDVSRTTRPVVLGASDAAAVCGLSPYSTPLHLYLEKRGELSKEFSDEQQERMAFGLKLEPIVLDAYALRMGVAVESDEPMFFHPEHDWMACTPDGIAHEHGSDEEWGVECKCTTWRMYDAHGDSEDAFGEDGTDQVPTVYLLQGHWQMAVMGWDRVDFPVLFDGSKLRVYSIRRNEDIIEQLIQSGKNLMEQILAGTPPDPEWSHDGTAGAIRALYGFNAETDAVELDDSHEALWWQYKELGATIKEIEAKKSEIHNRLLASFRGAAVAEFPNGQKLKRSVIADSYVTEEDVVKFAERVGEVKRKGHERLSGPRKRKD